MLKLATKTHQETIFSKWKTERMFHTDNRWENIHNLGWIAKHTQLTLDDTRRTLDASIDGRKHESLGGEHDQW